MTAREELDAFADATGETVLVANGFDDALLGYTQRVGQPTLAVYDRLKCIEVLMYRDGMTFEEAEEFFEYNVAGAWVGEGTPCFLVRLSEIDRQKRGVVRESKDVPSYRGRRSDRIKSKKPLDKRRAGN